MKKSIEHVKASLNDLYVSVKLKSDNLSITIYSKQNLPNRDWNVETIADV